MELDQLKKLVVFLRAHGVAQYTDGPLTLVLGPPKPKAAPRGRTAHAAVEEAEAEDQGDPRFFLERLQAANAPRSR